MGISSDVPPLNIGFDATWLAKGNKSGVGYYTEGLMTSLARNYPNIIFTGYYYGRQESTSLPLAPNLHYIRSKYIPDKILNLIRRLGIEVPFEILTRRRFDFLIFTSYLTRPSIFKTPSAVVIHDLAYADVPESLANRNRSDLEKFVPVSISRVKFIITISKWTKSRIIQSYNTAKPIIITPIPPNMPQETRAVNLNQALGISKKYILFIGTIEPRKNVTKLLDAYSLLPKEFMDNYSLVLVGAMGWKNESIVKKIKERQKEGLDIFVTGYVEDNLRESLFKNASLLVQPSLYEGFGMPLIEAMSNHVPVVVSDIEVFHEVCGDAALYANPLDEKELAKQILKVLSDKLISRSLVQKGDQNLKRYSWDKNAEFVYKMIIKNVGKK